MNRSTILFSLVALSLFAYIALVDTKEKGTREKEAVEKKLLQLSSDKIDRLTLIQEETTIELVKKDKDWEITKPFTYASDLSTVEQIISEMEFVETRRTIKSNEIEKLDETLKQWGLSTPTTHLIAEGDGKRYEIIVGRKVAVNNLYYAKTSLNPQDPVELISSFSRNNFSKKLSDLRSKDLFKFTSSDARKILVRQNKTDASPSEEREISLEKDHWFLQKPIKARGDRDQVNSWMSNLLGTKVVRFISEDSSNLNQYGLSIPKSQIQISIEENSKTQEQTLLIGAPTSDQPQEVYAKRLHSNTVFTIQKEAIEKILLETTQWRSKQFLPSTIRWSDISTIKIESKGKPLIFEKNDSGWRLSGFSNFSVDLDKVVQMMTNLQDVKATQFVRDTKSDLKSFGLDKPSLRLTLEGKNGETPFKNEITFGKSDKGNLYAMNSLEPFIYALPSQFNADWPKETWQWRSLQVLNIQKEGFPTKLSIQTKKHPKVVLSPLPENKWKSEDPNFNIQEPNLNAFWNTLSSLRGIRWLSTTPTAVQELQQPILRIELTTAQGVKALKIGASTSNEGRAAQIDGIEGIFEISNNDFETLSKEIVTPSK